jgi:3-hydroxyacyl-CoA dehydrogenase/enoyl-CoA hydratase/3-hydroxybutyryl-CoA epimerase
MGPVELADVVGLDVCLSVAENLAKHFQITIPEELQSMVARGRLGKKTSQGFYAWKKGQVVREKSGLQTKAPTDLTERLIFRMVNEAVACLREGIVTDGDLVDAGLIFGTGFAPFRGGPIHYLNKQGTEQMKAQLRELEQRYGNRFNPDLGWDHLVHAG